MCKHIDVLKSKALNGDLFALEELASIMKYYGKYDMAEEMYNKVIELDREPNNEYSRASFAYVGLGDLYLNNNIGSRDYQAAYTNYLRAANYGNNVAKQKIAHMYKKGIYLEKNYNKYSEMITEIYNEYERQDFIIPDIWYEMALIKYNDKSYDEARDIISIFELGCGFNVINIFSANYDINNIINIRKLQYKLGLINESEFDLYSLDAFSDKYDTFSFKYRSRKYAVNVKKNKGIRYYELKDQKYKSLVDLILKARIQNKTLIEIISNMTNFKVVR